PKQLRMALTALLRNAIEAAPPDGWAGVQLVEHGQTFDVQVDDNGPGPTPQQREHMFDPFYSGRSAGRGRGLGLPTAWRLARVRAQGGDVSLEEHAPSAPPFAPRPPRDIAWDDAPPSGQTAHAA